MDNQTEEKNEILLPANTPQEIVAFGQQAATQLVELVKQNKWTVRIQNKDYLYFEAWQTVGRFFGYTIKTVSTEYVDYDGVKGFAAKSVVVDSTGREVGAGEGLCLNDETNWRNKPLYAIKSMAQTRSAGRALRQVLAWVVVLAGYREIPAEEVSKEILDPAKSAMAITDTTPSNGAQRTIIARLISSGKVKMKYEDVNVLTFNEAREIIKNNG